MAFLEGFNTPEDQGDPGQAQPIEEVGKNLIKHSKDNHKAAVGSAGKSSAYSSS